MKNLPLLIGTIVVTLGLIVGIATMFSGSTNPKVEQIAEDVLVAENSHIKGPKEAPVTIVEFSDFQCPACRATESVVTEVLNQYPDQVRLAYRHFPLDTLHPYARLAAQAAEAVSILAGEEKFFEYHDLLFAKQEEWSQLENRDAVRAILAKYATEMELDKDQFLGKMEEKTVVARVVEDATVANQLNLGGTPTFFVNGRQTPAQQLLQAVKSIVETSNS